ncbi:RNA methyltransferase [Larsenimonas salina]|uniref:RNA methyltransferase n=1 Tax=Larsenimonas salina TaxID=1295565 RepID=UPI0020742605|nr:RNA methyltransferase [Larsenimonas salina]MCM5703285.1 RNA methyltransferase [Larsenimonas salina]
MLSNIKIVLVQTYHPGNIGSAARAMKTMGLNQLTLVAPRSFPDDDAFAMAAGATDLLECATVVERLEDAVSDCTMVIGASARLRSFPLPHFSEPDDMAHQVLDEARSGSVALVFGRERFGLTNDEIQCCTHQMTLPTAPDYPVLNLAQAVQICAHEVFNAWRKLPESDYRLQAPREAEKPTQAQMQAFFHHLEQRLDDAGFHNQPHARTFDRLRAVFTRAQPSKKELSMLRGMINALQSPTDESS